MGERSITRRRIVVAAGTAGTAALAGCSIFGEGEGEGEGEEEGDGEEGGLGGEEG